MKVLICGDRKWTNKEYVKKELNLILHDRCSLDDDCCYETDNVYIIEGEATGADIIGKEMALELGIPKENILSFPAPWGDIEGKPAYQIGTRHNGNKYWKGAGHYRNSQMLEAKPDLVFGIL